MPETTAAPLTRVDEFDGFWAKREDFACWERIDWPSGAKVRQYIKMIESQPDGLPLLVGCSAFGAMQIYLAAAAEKFGRNGIIYTPGRKEPTDATRYAISKGLEVVSVRPGWPSVYKTRARERGKALGQFVRWDFPGAVLDALHQTQNIPSGVRRVVVVAGSGLVAAGVLAGLAGRDVEVVGVAVCTMAHSDRILKNAERFAGDRSASLPKFTLVQSAYKYEQFTIASLPDGTPLDPFYMAKLLPFLEEGDCLWLTGLRPVCAMPWRCQIAFAGWRGPDTGSEVRSVADSNLNFDPGRSIVATVGLGDKVRYRPSK
jgi:hypothetical protein